MFAVHVAKAGGDFMQYRFAIEVCKQMRELVSAARGDFSPSSGKSVELEQVVALAQERREA